MKLGKPHRCHSVIAILILVVASMIPFTAIAGSHEATRVEATLTSIDGEPTEFGAFWQDANGGIHIRDQVSQDEISGAIIGTATTITNLDIQFLEGCEGEGCPPVSVNVWGTLTMEDETGSWKGSWVQLISEVPGDEYDLGYLSLRGYGGNADKSFIGRITQVDDVGGTIEGVLSTMASPLQSLNLSATLCLDGDSWSGGYLSSGVVDGSGGATGEFVTASGEFTRDSELYGKVEISDDLGTATLEFVGGGRDVESAGSFANHAFGTYVITGGTGAYAELYGQGRVTGAATSMPQCSSGFGAHIQFIGEAHMN